jgi:hypothetical protein
MIVADILMWFLLIAGTYIVINGYWLTTQGLFPDFVERCRERIRSTPFKPLLLGLGSAVPGFIIGVAMLRAPNPVLKFAGATLLLLLILVGLLGSAGLAAQVGIGLASFPDAPTWKRVWRGGLVLGLTFILPLIGWLIILPGTLIIGFGAAIQSIGRTASTRQAVPYSAHLAVTRQ